MFKKGLILFVISFTVVFVSCRNNQLNKTDQRHKAAFVEVIKILDGGNLDDLDNYIAEDAVDHQLDTSMTSKTGLEGIKEMFKGYQKIFPDMKTTIHSIAVSGDTLFAFITSVGTAAEPFMGMPAGYVSSNSSVDVLVFEGDKMKEHWGFMDMSEVMKMMQQMPMMEGMDQ